MKDRRCFHRYEQSRDLTFLFGSSSFRGTTIDYSLSGLSVELHDNPKINKGDIVNFFPPGSDMIDIGRVAWTSRVDEKFRIGIIRMGMLQGALAHYAFADVLLGCHRAMKTGFLYVIDTDATRSIFINGGDVTFATSTHPAERFTDMLVSEGLITAEQYRLAAKASKTTGKRFGAVLVSMGYINPETLADAVKRRVTDIIAGIFKLKDAEFLLREQPMVPHDEIVSMRLSPANLISAGIKPLESLQHLLWIIPPMDSVVGFSDDPIDLYQAIEFDAIDKDLLQLIDGRRTIADIIGGLQHPDAMRSLLSMLCTRVIEPTEGKPAPMVEVTVDDVVQMPVIESEDDFVDEIDFLFAHHEDIGYYGVLGLKQENATPEMIERAYHQKSKIFHPDRQYALPEHTREKLNAIFDYIKTAHKMLSHPLLRKQYDNRPVAAMLDKAKVNLAKGKLSAARIEFASERFLNAARLFEEASLLNSSVPEYQYSAAIAYMKADRLRDAETYIKRALKLAPNNAAYLTEAGYIYLALDLKLRARAQFERALNIDPNSRRAVEGMALSKKK